MENISVEMKMGAIKKSEPGKEETHTHQFRKGLEGRKINFSIVFSFIFF